MNHIVHLSVKQPVKGKTQIGIPFGHRIDFFGPNLAGSLPRRSRSGRGFLRNTANPLVAKGLAVEPVDQDAAEVRKERLALIVDRCLESEAAYKLFDMLGSICRLDAGARREYMRLVRESGLYSEEEMAAVERLIATGAAQCFKEVIDQVRGERIEREIRDLVS